MGKHGRRILGPFYRKERTQDSIQLSSSLDTKSSSDPSAKESGKEKDFVGRDREHVGERSSRASPREKPKRVLLSHVHGLKEIRRMAPGNGLEDLKPLHSMPTLQDGDGKLHKKPVKSGRVGGISRLIRCLPTHTSASQLSQISSDQYSRESLSVSSNVFRVKHSSSGVYQSNQSSGRVLQSQIDPDTYVSGRLAHKGRQPTRTRQRRPSSARQSIRVGLDNQQEKVRVDSHTAFYFPGNDSQLAPGNSETNSGEQAQNKDLVPLAPSVQENLCQISDEFSRASESLCRYGAIGEAPSETSSVVSKVFLAEGAGARHNS